MVVINIFSSSEAARLLGAQRIHSKLKTGELIKGQDFGLKFNRILLKDVDKYEVINIYIRPNLNIKNDINAELKLDKLGINYIVIKENEEAFSEIAGLIQYVIERE